MYTPTEVRLRLQKILLTQTLVAVKELLATTGTRRNHDRNHDLFPLKSGMTTLILGMHTGVNRRIVQQGGVNPSMHPTEADGDVQLLPRGLPPKDSQAGRPGHFPRCRRRLLNLPRSNHPLLSLPPSSYRLPNYPFRSYPLSSYPFRSYRLSSYPFPDNPIPIVPG